MSTSYFPIFQSLGINADQADLYTSLLQHGPQTAAALAKSTSVKRTYVYKLCEQLISLGLIRQEIKGKTTTFAAENPDHLLEIAESRKQAAETATHSLENLLPTLKSQFSATDTRPAVSYYEGVEGIKKVFKDIYAPKPEPVYGCVDLEASNQAVPDYIIKDLIPLRIKNNVFAKTLLADSPTAEKVAEDDHQSLRLTRRINKEKYPIPGEIDVYQDKIAMLSFEKGKFTGILIQNQTLATTLISIFKLAFKE